MALLLPSMLQWWTIICDLPSHLHLTLHPPNMTANPSIRYVRNAALIVGWAAATKTYVCDIIYGVGPSMEPVIPSGSVVVIDRLSARWRRHRRGDVVMVRSPTRNDGSFVIKRILALEGDVVELQPRFDESRGGRIEIPKGHVWIEGDNATMSVDSRHVGAVPAALIDGRVRARIWPWHNVGAIN